MTQGLSDTNIQVRMASSYALSEFGPAAKGAISALFDGLNDPNSGIRWLSVNAIRRIDPETAKLRKAELDAALAPQKQ